MAAVDYQTQYTHIPSYDDEDDDTGEDTDNHAQADLLIHVVEGSKGNIFVGLLYQQVFLTF